MKFFVLQVTVRKISLCLTPFFAFAGPTIMQFGDCGDILLGYDEISLHIALLKCTHGAYVAAGSPPDFHQRDNSYTIGRCLATYFELVDANFVVKQDKLRQIINSSSEISEPDRKWYLANLHKCRTFDSCIAKECNLTVTTGK